MIFHADDLAVDLDEIAAVAIRAEGTTHQRARLGQITLRSGATIQTSETAGRAVLEAFTRRLSNR